MVGGAYVRELEKRNQELAIKTLEERYNTKLYSMIRNHRGKDSVVLYYRNSIKHNIYVPFGIMGYQILMFDEY